ncbi:hypothetical protein N8083_00045 [Candidatus Pacebacteria bacterium]|nr:hypothetical protein [Candidatus Paceibacterota bacterium]
MSNLNMSYEGLIQTIRRSSFWALLVIVVLTIAFMAIEPVVSHAVDSNDFTITQTVSGAIAFATQPGDITMVGTLDGLTGGTSYGTTTARVTTNNASGYNMTITFSSTTAMIRGSETTREIYNYTYSTGTALYPAGYDTSLANAQFGFSVNASNTADVSDVFTGSSGTTCGTGGGSAFTLNDCWRGASSTDAAGTTELISTSAPTPASGSTSTVQFRVTIPNSPNPAVPDGTYTATATLTALDN